MDYRRKDNGLVTFMEHWWFLSLAVFTFVITEAFSFFTGLNGRLWIYFFIISSSFLVWGAGLIIRAKIPVYRSGKFFTFGSKSVPEDLANCYRWGWRIFLFGVVLSLCLLLSKQ